MGIAIFVFLILVALIIVGVLISIYNGLVALRNQVDRAWANIDVLLKQRFDEIPQLVQVLEQFAQYEQATIKKVMDARAHYGSASNTSQKIQASQELSFALKGIMAIGESYPELKSNQNFLQLQSRVSQLESALADRRETYNEAVTNYNTRLDQFPDVIFARMMQWGPRELFQVSEAEKVRPSLKMNLPV